MNAKPKKRKRRRRIIWLTVLLLIIGGAWYGIDVIAPYAVVQPPRYVIADHPDQFPNGHLPDAYGLTYEDLSIEVDTGLNLAGYYLTTSADSSRGCFLVMHGIGGTKEHMYGLAQKLTSIGFDVCLIDHRGHGQSGGDLISYGFYEKHDVSKVLDHLSENYGHDHFAAWGNSYGGAVALQAMAQDNRLRLGIIESTFNQLEEVVHEYQQRILGISSLALTERVLEKASKIADFDPAEVNPSESARLINWPVFLAHGDLDKRIPADHSREIYKNLTNPYKELYIVEGGTHFNLWDTGGDAYQDALLTFIDSNWGVH